MHTHPAQFSFSLTTFYIFFHLCFLPHPLRPRIHLPKNHHTQCAAMSYNQTRQDQPLSQDQHHLSRQVAKTATAVTVGGSLMVLAGLTLAATIIGLVLATPVLVIFSPVLVPAAITLFLIFAGFVTSGGFGATASFIFYWMYRYATGKHPIGADKIDRARQKIALAAREMKEKAEQLGQQTQPQIKGSQDT